MSEGLGVFTVGRPPGWAPDVLVTWELAARFGFVNRLLFPPPSKAFADLAVLVSSGYLWKALYASLFRVVCGLAFAVTVRVALGGAMARIRLINDFFDPLVELLRPVSPLALSPLAILWFGIGDGSKIFVIALAASFPVILNTFAGARSIDANLIRASRSLGATEIETFKGIVLPASLPYIFTGVRLAWGISLIVIIAAEMIGATVGMGYMVLEAQQTFRTERVFAGIFVIGAIGFATDLGFRRLRQWLLPWYRETEN